MHETTATANKARRGTIHLATKTVLLAAIAMAANESIASGQFSQIQKKIINQSAKIISNNGPILTSQPATKDNTDTEFTDLRKQADEHIEKGNYAAASAIQEKLNKITEEALLWTFRKNLDIKKYYSNHYV